MQHLKLFSAFILSGSLLLSCSGNSTVKASNENASHSASESTSSSDAIFSYNLDGIKISGGEADAMTASNVAAITKSDGKPDMLSFFLNDAYKDNTETVSHSMRFEIPDKTGNVALTSGGDNGFVELFLATSEEGKYVVYGNEDFNITITGISANHVSGTFSGKEKIAKGQGQAQAQGKDEYTITDGKFDIPVKPDAH